MSWAHGILACIDSFQRHRTATGNKTINDALQPLKYRTGTLSSMLGGD